MIIGYEAKRVYHNRSGLGNYTRSLVEICARHMPDNSYRLYNPSKGKIAFGDNLPNVLEVRPPLNNKLLSNLWRQKLVSVQAAKEGVQIFHGLSHELPADLKKNGLKSVVTIHDLIFMRYPHLYKWIDRKIYIKKVRLAVKRADKVVAISHQTKSDLIELLHVPQEKIEVIYQGCKPVFKTKIEDTTIQEVKATYGLPDEYVLFVGTLEERKNVDLILEANRSLKLPIVMIGRHTKYWKKLIQEEAYKDIQSLIFSPTVSDDSHLAAIYQGAKVFVYPSQFEGFGIPVIEALHSHVPVITSNSSSLPEAAGEGSKLIDIQTAIPLKEAITSVWKNTSLQQEMIEAGKEHIKQFSDEYIAKSWNNLYQSLLL